MWIFRAQCTSRLRNVLTHTTSVSLVPSLKHERLKGGAELQRHRPTEHGSMWKGGGDEPDQRPTGPGHSGDGDR